MKANGTHVHLVKRCGNRDTDTIIFSLQIQCNFPLKEIKFQKNSQDTQNTILFKTII